jgi:hypothetical protein
MVAFRSFTNVLLKMSGFNLGFMLANFYFSELLVGPLMPDGFERDAGQRETLYVPPNLTFKNSTFCMLFMDVRTNSDSFPEVLHCCGKQLLNIQGSDAV